MGKWLVQSAALYRDDVSPHTAYFSRFFGSTDSMHTRRVILRQSDTIRTAGLRGANWPRSFERSQGDSIECRCIVSSARTFFFFFSFSFCSVALGLIGNEVTNWMYSLERLTVLQSVSAKHIQPDRRCSACCYSRVLMQYIVCSKLAIH